MIALEWLRLVFHAASVGAIVLVLFAAAYVLGGV